MACHRNDVHFGKYRCVDRFNDTIEKVGHLFILLWRLRVGIGMSELMLTLV